ncbi:MAG: hypothetical protein IH840_14115 [Candidatus Heimdallarchaeota archaeon]|nr:hypothetical protein [Candidatus Heimdallarchaeota archaeon]
MTNSATSEFKEYLKKSLEPGHPRHRQKYGDISDFTRDEYLLYVYANLAKQGLVDAKAIRKAKINFRGAANLIESKVRPFRPPLQKIYDFLSTCLKQKIQGMSVVSRVLFNNNIYQQIRAYSLKAAKKADYERLLVFERIQARLFWQNLQPLMHRKGIPFYGRIYKNDEEKTIDLLNYRVNIVGNRLRNQTLANLGSGKSYFEEVKTHHSNFSTLDATEAIRPLLYYIAIQSISVPFPKIRSIVDEMIDLGIRWTQTWIASISSSVNKPKNLKFTHLLTTIQQKLREADIVPRRPFIQERANGNRPREGMVLLQSSTAESKAGLEIHKLLLAEYSQPLGHLKPDYIHHDPYSQIYAEFRIFNADQTIERRPDILIAGEYGRKELLEPSEYSDIAMIADLKTTGYVGRYTKLDPVHMKQVNSSYEILMELGYSVQARLSAIIYVRQNMVPDSLTPCIDTIFQQFFDEYHKFTLEVAAFQVEHDHLPKENLVQKLVNKFGNQPRFGSFYNPNQQIRAHYWWYPHW